MRGLVTAGILRAAVTSLQHRADDLRHLLDGRVEVLRILAAGFGQVGAAAAGAANFLGDGLRDLPGMQLGGQVLGDADDQRYLAVAGPRRTPSFGNSTLGTVLAPASRAVRRCAILKIRHDYGSRLRSRFLSLDGFFSVSLQNAPIVLLGVHEPLYRDAQAVRTVGYKVVLEASNRPNAHAGVLSLANLAGGTHLRHLGQFGIRLLHSFTKAFRGIETGVLY